MKFAPSLATKIPGVIFSMTLGTLACGVPLWPIPYKLVSMPGNPSPVIWLLLGTFAGLIAAYVLRPGWLLPWGAVAMGFGIAVLGRVAVETAKDPTSHNLWPIEVAIAGFFGLVSGLLGVALGRLIQRAAGNP
ncbi:MAG: hypothetical protein ABI672_06990 [Vicinamibacteria bacterium]